MYPREICGDGVMKVTSSCMCDRGLSRVQVFQRNGIRVCVPSRKGVNQVVFTHASALADRSIATERITVERNNLELRSYDGFNCQIPLSGISLAGAEASAARGLCNLKLRLVDWSERSVSEIDVSAGGGESAEAFD